MASLEELRGERIKKIQYLHDHNLPAYPADSRVDSTISDCLENFDSWQPANQAVVVAGRIMAFRLQGNIAFWDIFDGTGKIQILLKQDQLGEENFSLLEKTIDVGDFVELAGHLILTQRGAKTLVADTWRLLAKALRPLPDKWHGLQDAEEKLRKKYLDLLLNQEARELVITRAKFWQSVRNFLLAKNFLEVETPILENVAGGAEARPFITHHHALNQEVFLRISPELWLKRLLIAGFPKIFEIGRIFRNEGMDAEHLQDYTQLEFYWAYADYRQGMDLVRDLYRQVAQETFGTTHFTIKGFEIDLADDWQEYNFGEIIKQQTGIDIWQADLASIKHKLAELDITYESQGFNYQRAVDNLWKYCRRQLSGPGFLIGVPVFMEPLAKRRHDRPEEVERFQVILAGSELGKGFSELNDPLDQAERFAEQAKLRAAGDLEAQMNDTDFVEAMEYGMPPACGFGLSERLFAFLLDKPLRDCQIFPLVRPKNKS